MPRLRPRAFEALSAHIRRKDKNRYDGFPDLTSCWEQSDEHKKYFLGYMDCADKTKYHEQQYACRPFDDMVERFAGPEYRRTFFAHYRVRGRKPDPPTYIEGLADKRVVPRLALLLIEKKPRAMLENAPVDFVNWPGHFTMEAAVAIVFPEERRLIFDAIERCIERRILFRNACVRACNKRILTNGHDEFLLILQILRARCSITTRSDSDRQKA